MSATTASGRRGFTQNQDRPNPTTLTGRVVHAPAPGIMRPYPACMRYMHGIAYTGEPVNCPKCLGASS